jgi:hypothetical protein
MAEHPTGWIPDPEGVAAFREELKADGGDTPFGAKPALRGTWERLKSRGVTAVFAFAAEAHFAGRLGGVSGKYLPPWCQSIGACVGFGGTHAIQTQHLYELKQQVVVGTPKLLAWEFTYAYCRQLAIKRGALGSGDGAYGVDFARALHSVGVAPRGVYGAYDLSKSNEKLGYQWSQPGARIPQEVMDAAAGHTARCMFCDVPEERNDVLASGRCYGIASWTAWGRGRDGLFHPAGKTAHQEHDCGICVDEKGRDLRIRRNSHCGKEGKVTLRYAGGEIDLPLGAYPVLAAEEDATITRGAECWAYDLQDGWRPKTLTEAAQ